MANLLYCLRSRLPWIAIPYGAGEVLGGIGTLLLASRVAPATLLRVGLAVDGFGILLLGLSTSLWLTMPAQLVIALLQPAIFVGNQTLAMKWTDTAYIGRVAGIRTPLMTGAMLLGMGSTGAILASFSLTAAYGLAALSLIVGLLLIGPQRERKASPR